MKVDLLESGQAFSLSAGRPLYTGNSVSTLIYTKNGSEEEESLTLERFTRYTFDDTLSGSIISGKVYVLTPSGTERLEYDASMKGMPLIPGTRIIHE